MTYENYSWHKGELPVTDEVDMANDRVEAERERVVAALRAQAARIPASKPGDCDLCGEWSGRLVNGVCAPCRDRRGLE